MTLSYPKVTDANGALIDLQGIQKVRNYPMPMGTIQALNTTGTTFAPPRAIVCDVAGTATVTDAAGNVITGFPLTAGVNNLSISAISSLSGTTKVWGLY